jgi:hypothetical protein
MIGRAYHSIIPRHQFGAESRLVLKWIPMSNLPKIPKSGLFAMVGFGVLLPLMLLCYQAWLNPRIEFLVPSFKSRWILHSSDDAFPGNLSGTVLFRRRFILTAIPRQATLKVKAATQFRMSANGHVVEPASQSNAGNWKFARSYDIASLLVKSENTIEIRVTNSRGLPALMVQASLLENGLDLSSDTRWESAQEPDFSKWRGCIHPYQERPVLGEVKSPVQKSFAYPVLLGIYALFIVAAIKPWRLFYQPPDMNSQSGEDVSQESHSAAASRFHRLARAVLFLVAVLLLLSMNIHNLKSYPYERSCFDGKMHVDHIKYVASNWRVPLANQGWEMFQPPLYYFVSAIAYTLLGGGQSEPLFLKSMQGLGMLSGLACLLFTWLILRICLKDNRSMQLFGLCIAAFLPMLSYMSPTISNEVFSAAMMSLSLYLLIRYGFQDSIAIKHAVILGVVFGLAMLSKYTAFMFFLVATGILLLRIWIRAGHRRREAAILLIFTTVVFAVCGWFYIRNTLLFHNPFVGNWDEQSGYHVEQAPGYRTLGFYSKFGSVLTHAPERSRWSSFWDAYYGSMWMDTHFSMIDYRDIKASSYGSVILGLALLPSAAMLLGWFRSLKRILACRIFQPELAILAAVFAIMFAMIYFSLRVPSITTLKAFFSLSLLPAFGMFAGIGLHEMEKNLKKFSLLLYISLFSLFALISYLFWYRPI